jgi:hypothetical protein
MFTNAHPSSGHTQEPGGFAADRIWTTLDFGRESARLTAECERRFENADESLECRFYTNRCSFSHT